MKRTLICRGHHDSISQVAWSPDGSMIATASRDDTVRIWDSTTGRCLSVYAEHDIYVRQIAWSPTNPTLIASMAWDSEEARLWNPYTVRTHLVLYAPQIASHYLRWSPDGCLLAVPYYFGAAIYRIADQQVVWESPQLVTEPDAFAWTPDQTGFILAFSEGSLLATAFPSGERWWREQAHVGFITDLAISPNGSLVASCASDSTVQIRRVADGALLTCYRGHRSGKRFSAQYPNGWIVTRHRNGVWSVAWSLDSHLVASAGGVFGGEGIVEDPTVQIWDPLTGQMVDCLTDDSANVVSVAWSPKGMRLATASSDILSIWDYGQASF